jgi:type II secretory pathway pseudopilin PulG
MNHLSIDTNRRHRPGRSGPRQSGMTVLELIIVIGVVGLLVGMFYTGVRYISGADLREDTVEVASVLKAAYNMATTSGSHHRVVFDLDEQTYRIEVCEGDIKLHFGDREQLLEKGDIEALEELAENGPEKLLPEDLAHIVTPEQAARTAAALTGTRIEEATCVPPELPTGDVDGRGAERAIRTDRDIAIRSIAVQHLEDDQASGIVHINFFPLGRAEKAVIEIGDDDGNRYTLLVHGLTGRVEFSEGRVDPDDHMLRRADGESMDER